jgi:hypothetical protein
MKHITMKRGLLREGSGVDLTELAATMDQELLRRIGEFPLVTEASIVVDGEWLDLTLQLQAESWQPAAEQANALMDATFTVAGLALTPDENDEVAPGLVYGGSSMVGG